MGFLLSTIGSTQHLSVAERVPFSVGLVDMGEVSTGFGLLRISLPAATTGPLALDPTPVIQLGLPGCELLNFVSSYLQCIIFGPRAKTLHPLLPLCYSL